MSAKRITGFGIAIAMADFLAPTLNGADVVGTVRANGLELAYEQFGHDNAPALILIMGLGTQLTGWPDAFCRALADSGLRVIRFDNRDVGLSTKIRAARRHDTVAKAFWKSLRGRKILAPYGLEDMARDTIGLMDGLGIGQAHLVGASMGGMIAQIVAIKWPDRVLSLALFMTTTGARKLPRSRLKVLKRMAGSPKSRDNEAIAAYQAKTMRLIGSPKIGRAEADWKAEAMRSLERNYYPSGTVRQTLAVLSAPPRDELLSAVHEPVLIVHGAADPLLPVKHGRAVAAALPHARYEEMKDMGHDLPPRYLPRFVAWIVDLVRSEEAAQNLKPS